MAEFLIYNQDNWLDLPSKNRPDLTGKENVERKILEKDYTLAQRIKALALFEMKYEARSRRGDIVESRIDNGPRGKKEEESFAFVQVIGISQEDGKSYAGPHLDLTDQTRPMLIHRSKCYIDMTGLILDDNKNVILSSVEFNNRLKVKK